MISMPYHNPDRHKSWRYAQAKRDGLFLRVRKDEAGIVKAFTRHPTTITSQVRAYAFFGHLVRALPPRGEVWGELWSPGHPASHVKSVLAGNGEDGEVLSFDAFACPGLLDDHAPLENVNDLLVGMLSQHVPRTLVRFRPSETPCDLNWLPGLDSLPDDQEGWVLKHSHMTDWTKLKPVKTMDVVVVGLIPGEGKYLGQCGSLRVSVVEPCGHLREVASVSGMDDKTRHMVDESWVGRVVEVRYQYVGAGGRLRHPAFLRVRDDKSPTHQDCGLNQDPAL